MLHESLFILNFTSQIEGDDLQNFQVSQKLVFFGSIMRKSVSEKYRCKQT